ncbi:PAAR domain-containing protein [bacterium]|nr:PAAR domain-containing protein [bacterium]
MLSIGLPHGHSHPPSLIPPAPPVPLPVIGPITLGCCVQVLINGMPAARVGDMGFNPTCVGIFPSFEIFTGSSKVFIGGMRAARTLDVTMHCWPPKSWLARGAIAALVAAAKAAMMVVMVAGTAAQVSGIIADSMEADQAEAEGAAAMGDAKALSAGMAAAQMAADAAAMAVGMLMGKDPAVGSPTGVITTGHPNVLIGGFPMPSGMQIAGRILAGAKRSRRSRRGRSAAGACSR